MKNANLILFCVCCFLSPIAEAELANQKKDKSANEGNISDFEGAFTIKHWDKDMKLPEVKDDKKNIIIEKFTENELAKIAEPEGLAAKLELKEKISWKPLWRFEGAGSVNLPSSVINKDKSLLAIVETTGEAKGPNGSRIIILRTSDWLVLRIHELKQKKVDKIAFLPDSNEIIASAVRQPEIKENNELIIFDFDTGSISKTRKYRNHINDFICVGGKIIAAFYSEDKNEMELYEIDKDTLAMRTKFQTSNSAGILHADTINNDRFLFAGNKNTEVFSLSQNEPLAKIANPENSVPAGAEFLPGELSIVISHKAGNANLIRNSSQRTLLQNADAAIVFDKGSSILLLTSIKNDKAVIFEVPEYNETDSFSISSIRPRTRGDIIFASFLGNGAYLFVDDHGNIFTCRKSGKRWRKEIHLEAMR